MQLVNEVVEFLNQYNSENVHITKERLAVTFHADHNTLH